MSVSQEKDKKNIPTISLFQLCWEFLVIGTIGFGGGWVIISLIHNRFVKQKQLISDEDFTTGISLSQFLGAFAVNTTSYIGRKLKGIHGAILSTFFFLLPSFIIVCILSELYFRYNKIVNFEHLLKGISPVIIALMLSTPFDLSTKLKKDIAFLFIFTFVIIGGLLNINYVVLLIISGSFQLIFSHIQQGGNGKNNLFPIYFLHHPYHPYNMLPTLSSLIATTTGTSSLFTISWVFLGIGFIFFGGGYSLLPLFQNIFVNKLHWISNHDFIIGITISQATPGPFAVIATFLGYYLHGITGAIIATFMIFLPAFVFLQILITLQNSFKDNKNVQAFLRGINIAIIGQLLLLSYHFFIDTLIPPPITSVILLLISLLAFSIYRIPAFFLLIIGITYGLLFVK